MSAWPDWIFFLLVVSASSAAPHRHALPTSDPALATLEDLYGDTGNRFQAAFGFRTFEPTAASGTAPNSYGVAVDDMVISWKETRLDEDTHDCSQGTCATVELGTGLAYDTTSFLEVTVTDASPYDPVHPKNDCNGDGDFDDPGDDQDCNDNGIPDVTVRLTSDGEPTGEIAVLDRIAPGSPVYKTRFPYSTIYDSPGTLFLTPVFGVLTATATYDDRDDGTGSRCKNAIDPGTMGMVAAHASIVATSGKMALKSYTLKLVGTAPTNGDNDGFADTDETIDLAVTLSNKTGIDLTNVVVTLDTSSPAIECIAVPVVPVGSVAKGATFTTPSFRFKVAGAAVVNRTSVDQVLNAGFNVGVHAAQFDASSRPLSLLLQLDLNATGGSGPSPFVEDFEVAGMGKFTLATLDLHKNSPSLSDGMRCQYNDPDGRNTNSAGEGDCFLGFATDPSTGVNDWHVHTNAPQFGNVGRAYTGTHSAHYGVHMGTTAKRDTTRFKQLVALKTWGTINLPLANAAPELNFAHQVSLVDNRGIGGITNGETADRAIVEVSVLNSMGFETTWLKLYPYENLYDEQGTDNFTNCTFDPTDDGNDEDSFFDPNDPDRRLGPSSTCFPEFVFAYQGNTDWQSGFNAAKIGLAEGPALQGAVNVGTWVRPRFSLQQFAGRKIRLRFLATSIELGTVQLWDSFFGVDNVAADDGWYIDDVHVDQALGIALTLAADTKTITPIPCGTCSSITAALGATGSPTAGPGQLVTLDAGASTVDVCPGGVVQYQFWIDANGNGVVGDAGDSLLRDFTDLATFLDAPQRTTRYGVKVRCSSSPGCDTVDGSSAATTLVTVNCPSTGNLRAAFGQTIRVDKSNPLSTAEPDASAVVSWPVAASVDAIRGSLSGSPPAPATATLKGGGGFTGTVIACVASNSPVTSSIVSNEDPGAGNAFYVLVRGQTTQYCNQSGPGYTSGAARERAGRDAELDADPVESACP